MLATRLPLCVLLLCAACGSPSPPAASPVASASASGPAALPPLPPPPPNGPAGHATPLHAAAKSANLAELTRLIAASPRDIDAPDERGLTALHLACAGSLGVARLLLDAGARSLPNKAGKTPFDLAQAKGSPALAELLKTAR